MTEDIKTGRPGAAFRFGFIPTPDFALTAFTAFIETLRQAAEAGGGPAARSSVHWEVMSVTDALIRSSCGVELKPDSPLRDPAAFDYVVVVGGSPEGFREAPARVLAYLTAAAAAGATVIGLAGGIFWLAAAGLLKDRRCSLHWHHYQTFKNNFPEAFPIIDEPFVEDRGVITCPAGPDVASLALYLMEACFGTERLMRILRNMLLDAHQPPEHPRSSQLSDYRNLADPRIRQAVFFMEQNIASPITAEEAAEAAGISARQLERLFQVFLRDSPAGYFRKLRLRHAAWLLRNTRKSITDIALECGFSDSSHFAKRYRELFGHAPGRDRQNARNQPAADDQATDFQSY